MNGSLTNGFLQEVMKGWLISSSPSARDGDSTPWYASFWEFCARYCNERFGDEWHLSPEQSLFLHGERTVIPDQVVVNSPKGTNNTIGLLFGTSLYDLKVAEMPASGGSRGAGRPAAFLAGGGAGEGGGILLRPQPGRDRRWCSRASATPPTCCGCC